MADPAASRGVLYPASLPTFHRVPVTGHLSVFVRWFWIPEWNIAGERASRQHVIGFPACNLVVEGARAEVSGPTTRATYRELRGSGWAVGAFLRPAAVPELIGDPRALRNVSRAVELPRLCAELSSVMNGIGPGEARRSMVADRFSEWLSGRLGTPTDEALRANRMVEAAESQRTIHRVTDLAAHLNTSVRSLQRLASRYVGVSPAFLIRRRRLHEAAEKLRQNPGLDLTVVAHESGYADHAHLTRDFRTTLGFTPSSYRSGLPTE